MVAAIKRDCVQDAAVVREDSSALRSLHVQGTLKYVPVDMAEPAGEITTLGKWIVPCGIL